MQATTVTVRFTADVIMPDDPCDAGERDPLECDCTFVYGDACEHGYGATLASGWVEPSWSRYVVYDEPTEPEPIILDPIEDYAPDVAERIVADVLAARGFDTDGRIGTVETIASAVLDIIGAPDSVEDGHRDGSLTIYAADEDQDYRTGESARLAAHLDGIPAELLAAVADRLRG